MVRGLFRKEPSSDVVVASRGAGHINARAAPEGYTLTMGNSTTPATNRALIPATPFDASKDSPAEAKAGFDITPSNPTELADFVEVEMVKSAKVKDSGAKAE